MKIFVLTVSILLSTLGLTRAREIDLKQLQCLVCRSSVEELEGVLGKIKPSQGMEVGNFRLDGNGNMIRKKIPLAKSEIYISEVLENICDKMEDYVRATYKSNGDLTVLKLMTESGHMNPEMSNVDIIQDDDLNKSLKYYCEELVELHEEPIIDYFRKGETDIINKICTETSKFCSAEIPSDQTVPDDEQTGEEEEEEQDRMEL